MTPSIDLVVCQEKLRFAFFTAFAIVASMMGAASAQAALLPFVEDDGDSDLVVITNVSGSYTAGIFGFTGTATQLDVGPGTGANHTGFGASVALSGVAIDSSGNITSPGSLVVTYLGPPSSSLTTAFPVLTSNPLMLQGEVLEVMMGASTPVGNDNMEIAFAVTGGALSGEFGGIAGIKLNAASGGGLPDNFSGNFSFASGTTVDIIGPIPEPRTITTSALSLPAVYSRATLLAWTLA